jgi:hypothetical protein
MWGKIFLIRKKWQKKIRGLPTDFKKRYFSMEIWFFQKSLKSQQTCALQSLETRALQLTCDILLTHE